jgi:transposase InsO family protein
MHRIDSEQVRSESEPLPKPLAMNRSWSVVDQWSRWSPILEVGQSMSGRTVAEALDRAIAEHGKPRTITVDHGTEFTSRVPRKRLYRILQRQVAR